MTDPRVPTLVAQAAQKAYDAWAAEHPALAGAIDRIALVEQAARSLRDSDDYRAAIAHYHQARSELDLLDRLTELAGPILQRILGL